MQMNEMREKIKIMVPVEPEGPFAPLDEYEELCILWAKAEFLKGQEFWAAKGVNSEHTVRFITRHRKGIDTTMAVEYEGKRYDIQAVMPLNNKKRYMAILCKIVESGGF
mgnify:CR=1 FL=1